MANKTTKAQRRAAKLNRRSKAYRKKIAAAEKKTSSEKVKNPTPKRVCQGKTELFTDNIAKHDSSEDLYVFSYIEGNDKLMTMLCGAKGASYEDTQRAAFTLAAQEGHAPKQIFALKIGRTLNLEHAIEMFGEGGFYDTLRIGIKAVEAKGLSFAVMSMGEFLKLTCEVIEAFDAA